MLPRIHVNKIHHFTLPLYTSIINHIIMKNSLFLCYLFFIPLFAFAQSANTTLDSMYYGVNQQNTNVRYYKYDEQNRLIETLSRNKDLPITFQSRNRFEYLNKETIETSEKWLVDEQRWENQIQTIDEFNAVDNIIKKTVLDWNTATSQFEISWFRIYEYDIQGNLIKEMVENQYEYTSTYNERNQLVNYERIFWNNSTNQMELFHAQTKNYDDKYRLISDVEAYSNGRIEEKHYTYDSKNRINTKIEIFIFESDTMNNNLTNHIYHQGTNLLDKTITNGIETNYTYDSFGNISQIETEQIHSSVRDIVLEAYVYNDNNLLIEKHLYIGLGYTMELYSYDENGEMKTYDYYLCDQFCGNGSNEHHEVHFRSKKSNITPIEQNITCLFPNPYSNFQQITCDELSPEKIYDLMVVNIVGQQVYNTKFSGRNGFFINQQLDKGWYVFVVLDEGEIVTKQKILVF